MSLLMKALEKAAKDRGEARQETPVPAAGAAAPAAPAPVASRQELSLEPMAAASAPAPAAAPRIDPVPRPAGAPHRTATGAPPAAPMAAPARDPAQAQASTVLQAQAGPRPASGGAGGYLRSHPIVVLGSLAGIVAIAFGIYVYLQIFHPDLFVTPAPVAQGPQSAPVPAPQPPAPIPAAPLLKEAAAEAVPAAPPAAAAEAPRKPQPAPPVAAEEGPRSTISVSAGSAEPTINPLLTRAYAALQAGRTDEAQSLYGQLATAEPRNVDALLGLAAIAAQQGQVDEAVRRYLQILDLEPRHALAQSGLIALLGRADPLAAESRLRQLIAREPSAYLHFTLGNLYADQSQWAAAQQSYFQAHHLESANPDYAYNLAIALEHVSQPKLALGFYRRAVELAAARGRSNFSVTQAQQRIARLAQQVE